MAKRNLFIITGLIIAAFAVMALLNSQANTLNTTKNGFTRRFLVNPISSYHTAKFENNFSNIVGYTPFHFYLSTEIPGELTQVNLNLTDTVSMNLNIPRYNKLVPLFYTSVDSPHVSIMGGNMRSIIRSDLTTGKHTVDSVNSGSFSNAIAIGNSTYVMRFYDQSIIDDVFRKVNLSTKSIQTESAVSNRKGDAGFSYDGQLCYDETTHTFLYVCFYCNRFESFDTSLNLLYKATTIDTSITPKVNIIITKKSVTHAKPPIAVNRMCSAYGGNLYVQSKLKADNETNDFFNNNVIDVYNIADGSYKGSFYLPSPHGEKLKRFRVIRGNLLVALYENSIIGYSLKI